MSTIPSPPLLGRMVLVLGTPNEYSIVFGCARAFRKLGAELVITYLNGKARKHVEPLRQGVRKLWLGARLIIVLVAR